MSKCELCGEPMPEGEEMFVYHGYSGPCPKPPLPDTSAEKIRDKVAQTIWRDQPAMSGGLEKAYELADQIISIFEEAKTK